MSSSDTTAMKSAKDFDADAFMARFTPYRPEVRMHRNGALKTRIDELAEKIVAANRSEIVEESLADEGTIDDLIEEHDRLVEEFEADVQVFVFRATISDDYVAARKAAIEAMDLAEDAPEPNGMVLMEAMYPYLWAATVIEPAGMTAEVFKRMGQLLGDGWMGEMATGWDRVASGGVLEDVSAPFSRKPWRIPTKEKPAPDSE